jgi:uncharacterized protein YqjF (DUF2071 family)
MGRRLVHPVPMRTVFRHCFLANFAIRPAVLGARLPDHLRPEEHDGWSFLSVVIAEMERMRPAFLPRALGITYTQVVYRAVVSCGGERGVHFLRSDADNGLMALAGNALTFFRFHRCDAAWEFSAGATRFSLRSKDGARAGIEAEYDLAGGRQQLPSTSRFSSLERAQAFLTELYVAFGNRRPDGRIDAVRIHRNPWRSLVVQDRVASYEAMESGVLFGPGEAELDSIFFVESLDYHWFRGTTVAAD